MDTSLIKLIPYNPFLAKVIQKILKFLPDGPLLTKYGYWIDYKKTGQFATALRTFVISGSYERMTFKVLERLINPGDIAIDVGAHEGFVSLWLSKLGASEVFAIEPNPENLAFLCNNIRLNQNANIKIIEKAVSDKMGKMNFYCSPDAGANGSLIPFSYFSENKIEVEVDTLDNLFGNLERLDFLKIDTEGNELKVLMGARKLLEQCKPQICFEVSLTFWTHLEQSVDTLFNFLRDLDYELFVLKGTRLQPYHWLDERTINMFALHRSKASRFGI